MRRNQLRPFASTSASGGDKGDQRGDLSIVKLAHIAKPTYFHYPALYFVHVSSGPPEQVVSSMYGIAQLPRPAIQHLIVCYLGYLLAALYGQWMMVVPGLSITVWPPNGIVLAVLLLSKRQTWPWWILVAAAGELTSNAVWFRNPLGPALGYVIANALEVLFAAAILTRIFASPLVRFKTLAEVLAFLSVGVVAGPMIGATLGSLLDVAVGKRPFSETWPLWWLGDATGILIATPLVVSLINAWREKAKPTVWQAAEAVGITVLLGGLGFWALSGPAKYAFMLFVPIIWAALRYEMRGAGLAILMITLMIAWHAQVSGARADLDDSPTYRHAMLQAFIAVAASIGLIVAAIIRQYRQALSELKATNNQLEQRVEDRTHQILAAEQRFKATFQNAAVGMSIVNPQGVLERVNGRLAHFLGYEVGELEGRPLDAFTHPDDLETSHLAWQRLESGAADAYQLEKRYIRRDGGVVWGQTSVSCVRHPRGGIGYLIKVIQDVTARQQSDEARQLLMHELNHRGKNMLSTIHAIARQTAAKSPDAFIENFGQRLRALGASQDLLVKSNWSSVKLEDLVRSQLAHFESLLDDRISICGPPVSVSPHVAQAVGMALHELGTNAAKHGSLSNDVGRVSITWALSAQEFEMSWSETGGPRVSEPKTLGFGSTVIDRMVRASIKGDVLAEFASTGFTWRLRCPVEALEGPPQSD